MRVALWKQDPSSSAKFYRQGMSETFRYQERLRKIRLAQGLTLKQVEIRSRGIWKAVVVGSYERGTRSLSIDKAIKLCDFYGIPLAALFHTNSRGERAVKITLDLLALRRLTEHGDPFVAALRKLCDEISIERGDWNGQVISLRSQDWRILKTLLLRGDVEVRTALENRGLLHKITNR